MRSRRAGLRAVDVLLGLAPLLVACTTTSTTDPVGLGVNVPVRTEAARAWRLVHDDHTLGYVVLFAEPGSDGRPDRLFFSVRNPWQQELGSIDGLGRVWRFLPHQEAPEWITTGTVLEGAAAILSAPPAAALEEVPLELLGARADPAAG